MGHQFVLNGRKLFLSGYGYDAPFSDTIAAPSDKAYHLRQARLAKSHGFNFVRCHSHFLPPEFYDALDEVGIFVSPELPVVYGSTPSIMERQPALFFSRPFRSSFRRFFAVFSVLTPGIRRGAPNDPGPAA